MPELRIDPICGRRVYIAEERAGRPTDYQPEAAPAPDDSSRRAMCPFCAGNEAATPVASATVHDAAGQWRVRVVPNKFPAMSLHAACGWASGDDSGAKPQAAVGAHEVIIESPAHAIDVLELNVAALATVLGVYRDRLRRWVADGRLLHGIVFKNSGFAAGASLEHIHSQLVVLPYVSPMVEAEIAGAERFHAAHGRCIFCDLMQTELAQGERLVFRDGGYVALCPYAARQPYETWILPERHASRFEETADADLPGMAAALRGVLQRLTAMSGRLGYALAYNLVLHTGPFDGAHADAYHWHWELVPRTTHLAGLEWGAGVFINPVSPERAARDLREVATPSAPQAQPA